MKYKKYILDKLPDTTILEILEALVYEKPKNKINFLKQYSLTGRNEELEPLTKIQTEYNYEILKRIYKRINEKRLGLFNYRTTKKYKTFILDKLPDCLITEILEELIDLKPIVKERLLREYSLIDKKEPIGKLNKSDTVANSYTLKKIQNNIHRNRNKLNIPNNKKQAKSNFSAEKEHISFFELLKKYKKEDILKSIDCLDKEEKNLLYKKYGNNLKELIKNKYLTKEEIKKIRFSIMRKIRRTLEKMQTGEYEIISIVDELSYKYDELIEITNKLNESLQYKIYSSFGEDLKKKTIKLKNKPFFTLEEKELIERTYKNRKGKHQIFNAFISQFESVRKVSETDEELLLRIKRNLIKIKNEHQELIYRKYDKDLQNTQNKFNYTKEENQKILRIIIPSIKGFMLREERNLQNEIGRLGEVEKLLNTSEYKLLESLYGTKYAFSIMYKLYLDESYKLDGIVELNKDEELLILLLAKDFLNKKKNQEVMESVDIKELIKRK